MFFSDFVADSSVLPVGIATRGFFGFSSLLGAGLTPRMETDLMLFFLFGLSDRSLLLLLLSSLVFLSLCSTLLYAGGVPRGVCDDGVGLFTFMMMVVSDDVDDDQQ